MVIDRRTKGSNYSALWYGFFLRAGNEAILKRLCFERKIIIILREKQQCDSFYRIRMSDWKYGKVGKVCNSAKCLRQVLFTTRYGIGVGFFFLSHKKINSGKLDAWHFRGRNVCTSRMPVSLTARSELLFRSGNMRNGVAVSVTWLRLFPPKMVQPNQSFKVRVKCTIFLKRRWFSR